MLPNPGELPFDISKHPACRHAEKSLSRWSEERAGITSKNASSRFQIRSVLRIRVAQIWVWLKMENIWKTLLKFIIWGYPYFWKHPSVECSQMRRDVQLLSSYVLLQDMAFFRERAAGTTQYMLKLKVRSQGVN